MVRLHSWFAVFLVCLLVAVGLPRSGFAQEYTIGPRDVLAVTVWGQADLSRDYTVDPDGFVPFPLVGRVKAAGSTPKQLAAELTELLGKDYLVNPQVIVFVREYLSQKVQVLGSAEKPGVYYLTGPTTVLEILSKAGGLSSTAGKQVILLRNHAVSGGTAEAGGDPIVRLSLDKIQAGDSAENTRLENQDTVIVSKALSNSYFIFGEVKKPGGYTLDKETNILEGITIAGGFTDKAAPSRTRVIRSTPEGQKVIEVDMNDILRRGRAAKTVMLQESDVVVVPESFF
jgi:polysaccharide export outer membrane protein